MYAVDGPSTGFNREELRDPIGGRYISIRASKTRRQKGVPSRKKQEINELIFIEIAQG
jgi:hypothetical protein